MGDGMGACLTCRKKKGIHSDTFNRLTFIDINRAELYLLEAMAHNKAHFAHLSPTEDDFKTQLKEAGSKLVIVDFFATWCGPCIAFAPKFEELAESMPDVVFLKVDVDQIEALATEYNINCMPTFVAIKEGKRLAEISGANMDKLKVFIKENK